jgi:hypothetical protein
MAGGWRDGLIVTIGCLLAHRLGRLSRGIDVMTWKCLPQARDHRGSSVALQVARMRSRVGDEQMDQLKHGRLFGRA